MATSHKDDTCNAIAAAVAPIATGILIAIANDPAAVAAARKILGIEEPKPQPPKTTDLTKTELAEALSTSPSTIDRFDRQGAPFRYLGDQKRYDLEPYRAHLAARGKRPASSNEAAE